MKIRIYTPDDCLEIIELFRTTVKNINKCDYTDSQIQAWITNQKSISAWNRILSTHKTYVATIDNMIVGFIDIDDQNTIDHLFVHYKYQNQHIASDLCSLIEKESSLPITTFASITSKPFFEKRGYVLVCENSVTIENERLINFKMRLDKIKQ